MRRRTTARAALAVCGVVALAACDDDAPRTADVATSLCPIVQAWSDLSVDAVDAFRLASRDLNETERRTRYAAAFDELQVLLDRFADELDDLDLPEDVEAALDQARTDVAAEFDDGLAEAASLPDSAYEFVAVRDGSLVTGVEKAKAIVFAALAALSQEPGSEIPAGCGRRGALDLSPSSTFPS